MSKEILEAVKVLEHEKGISSERLMEALEDALLSAYKKTPGAAKYARVDMDRHSGDFKVFERELARGRPVLVGMLKRTLGGLVTHFEVVVGYHPVLKLVATLDPSLGARVNDETGFDEEWELAKRLTLVVFRLKGE